MRRITVLIVLCMMLLASVGEMSAKSPQSGVVNEITQTQYKVMVSDYTQKKWNFKGKRPAIVDFSATWCGPCRRLAPILDDLAKTYKGKIDFYKVDVDKAQALAKAYGISSVPTVIFIPVSGEPASITGLYPKNEIIEVINHTFYGKKK